MSAVPEVSVVVPAHNSESLLPATWEALRSRFDSSYAEVIFVENGSTDHTWDCVRAIGAGRGSGDPHVVMRQSKKGLGNALRAGVLASRGNWVWLTGDDLPFGFTDWDAFSALQQRPDVTIGSKAHPRSSLHRDAKRRTASVGFRLLRRLILNSRVGDSQGTFVLAGDFARSFAAQSREEGFLWTTELVFAAERSGLAVVEVPVTLVAGHGSHSSRVSRSDVRDMFEGLWRIRGSHERLQEVR